MKLVIYFEGSNIFGTAPTIINGFISWARANRNNDTIFISVPGCTFYHTVKGRWNVPSYESPESITNTQRRQNMKNAFDSLTHPDHNGQGGGTFKSLAADLKHDAHFMKNIFFSGDNMKKNVEAYAERLTALLTPWGNKWPTSVRTTADDRHDKGDGYRFNRILAIYPPQTEQQYSPAKLTKIILCGFSRGGVMCFILAKLLSKDKRFRNIPVCISVLEPVPGNFNIGTKIKKKLYNFTPLRSNALEAQDLSACRNIQNATIYLGAYNNGPLNQMIPTFYFLTKSKVFGDERASKHGRGYSQFTKCVATDVRNNLKDGITKVEAYEDLEEDWGFIANSINVHSLVGHTSRRGLSRIKPHDVSFFKPFNQHKSLFGDLLTRLREQGSYVVGATKKFKGARSSMLKKGDTLKFNSLPTIKYFQSIVRIALKHRRSWLKSASEMTSTGSALARIISLANLVDNDKMSLCENDFYVTRFGYLGILVQMLTYKGGRSATPSRTLPYSTRLELMMYKRLERFQGYDKETLEEKLRNINSNGRNITLNLDAGFGKKIPVELASNKTKTNKKIANKHGWLDIPKYNGSTNEPLRHKKVSLASNSSHLPDNDYKIEEIAVDCELGYVRDSNGIKYKKIIRKDTCGRALHAIDSNGDNIHYEYDSDLE
ncbi:MAG: hypothetical protein GY718_20550 [Lentisphaerae bacterium]|nr:hypothetical protein [Lentisphaerota bacterium]